MNKRAECCVDRHLITGCSPQTAGICCDDAVTRLFWSPQLISYLSVIHSKYFNLDNDLFLLLFLFAVLTLHFKGCTRHMLLDAGCITVKLHDHSLIL